MFGIDKEIKRKQVVHLQPLYDLTNEETDIIIMEEIVTPMMVDEFHMEEKTQDDLNVISQKLFDEIRTNWMDDFDKVTSSEVQFVEYKEFTSDTPSESTIFRGPVDGFLFMVCLSQAWSKHQGGDIITYVKSEPERVFSTHPGRIIIMRGNTWIKVTPPTVDATEKLAYLFFRVK